MAGVNYGRPGTPSPFWILLKLHIANQLCTGESQIQALRLRILKTKRSNRYARTYMVASKPQYSAGANKSEVWILSPPAGAPDINSVKHCMKEIFLEGNIHICTRRNTQGTVPAQNRLCGVASVGLFFNRLKGQGYHIDDLLELRHNWLGYQVLGDESLKRTPASVWSYFTNAQAIRLSHPHMRLDFNSS